MTFYPNDIKQEFCLLESNYLHATSESAANGQFFQE